MTDLHTLETWMQSIQIGIATTLSLDSVKLASLDGKHYPHPAHPFSPRPHVQFTRLDLRQLAQPIPLTRYSIKSSPSPSSKSVLLQDFLYRDHPPPPLLMICPHGE
ncbi:hypothetical protein K470DRAFT_29745 [Piedraia hortae CBS 480.64]|uniref:Uncharacterized protein n=1 Tax=Piedraia hortae CBS 480.64 TaxID=1314780 RepID=A0A6A7C4X7_9PEZI|nr:hypothetical protein K470DRAFT_29745 [Piedraia hortae CBS 480.64]